MFFRGDLRHSVLRVVFISSGLTWFTFTGRSELRVFFGLYLVTLIFQILTNGSVIQQGTKSLVVLTAIHAGLVATLFWALLGNAIVATQIVEDGTLSALIVRYLLFPKQFRGSHSFEQPLGIISIFFFVATTYISLDIALLFNNTFGPSNPQQALNSIPLFVLTSIWPGAYVFFRQFRHT